MLSHCACARVRPLFSLHSSTCTYLPPTTHHPPTAPRRKPALVREGHHEEGQPPRATTSSDGEERDVERVARMRPDTRGGLPGAISRGRRCRRPKTLVARVVDVCVAFSAGPLPFSGLLICILLTPFSPFPSSPASPPPIPRTTPRDI